MYNRYIPQPDGSFHRKQIPDIPVTQKKSTEACSHSTPPQDTCTKEPHKHPNTKCRNCPGCRKYIQQTPESKSSGIGALLHQILPKDFDSGDLMVILLLLLMSSDQSEDQTTALLTLALYLFL
jgi:hypothetical protein